MTDPHEHEFIEEEAEFTADETLLCEIRCMHRPVYGSYTSEKYDETFYDEGPRCEARKRIQWDFDGVYFDLSSNVPVAQATGLVEVPYEKGPEVWESVVSRAEHKINETDVVIDPYNDTPWTKVHYDGDLYIVKWENRTERVDL